MEKKEKFNHIGRGERRGEEEFYLIISIDFEMEEIKFFTFFSRIYYNLNYCLSGIWVFYYLKLYNNEIE